MNVRISRSAGRHVRRSDGLQVCRRWWWSRLHVELLEYRCLLAANQFAVIGDYGFAGANELAVANLVKSWDPAFVITVGDNNYPGGAAATIDANIGQYYHEFIGNYTGSYGTGSATNRFFPSLGNHDWDATNAQPYLDYFTLPGNERYYDYVQGPVHFFAIDSDTHEPDGRTQTSTQAAWLNDRLSQSTSSFNVVYFHHSPYSSSDANGSTTSMQWPFKEWGADVVLAGHDHVYERLTVNGLPYFVDGLGGHSIHGFGTPIDGSQVRYRGNYGAMLVTFTSTSLTLEFHSISNGDTLIDRFVIDIPDVTNTSDSGPGSLRQAILDANSTPGSPDTIIFAIPGVGPQAIRVDSPLPDLIDPVTFDLLSGQEIEIGTSGLFTLPDYATLTKIGAGSLTIGGSQNHAGTAELNVNVGILNLNSDGGTNLTLNANALVNFGSTQHLAGLNVGPGAVATLLSGGGKVLVTSSLAIDATGKLDLADNDLVIHATAATRDAVLADVTAKIGSGFSSAAPHWTGPGINSTAAAADSTHLGALGVLLNDAGGSPLYVSFSGEPVGVDDILIKYTYVGDGNLNGVVDGTDYALIDNGFNFGLTGWRNGDFNYSGAIDGTDYAYIDNAFNHQAGTLAAKLFGVVNATIADSQGLGTIVNDDRPKRSTQAVLVAALDGLLQTDAVLSRTPFASANESVPAELDHTALLDPAAVDRLFATAMFLENRANGSRFRRLDLTDAHAWWDAIMDDASALTWLPLIGA